MRLILRLLTLGSVAALLAAVLAATGLQAVGRLSALPSHLWSSQQLGDCAVAAFCLIGALASLWHLASALLATFSLLTAGTRAGRIGAGTLRLWGAPVVRRITAGALVVGLSSAPALAQDAGDDTPDLGWSPTTSQSTTTADDTATQVPAASHAPTPPAETAPAPSETADARTVTIQPGDSLWSVTAAVTGQSNQEVAAAWPLLYQANIQNIGEDPNLVRPGLVLTIPPELAPPSDADQ